MAITVEEIGGENLYSNTTSKPMWRFDYLINGADDPVEVVSLLPKVGTEFREMIVVEVLVLPAGFDLYTAEVYVELPKKSITPEAIDEDERVCEFCKSVTKSMRCDSCGAPKKAKENKKYHTIDVTTRADGETETIKEFDVG